jgi:hypothetical protein
VTRPGRNAICAFGSTDGDDMDRRRLKPAREIQTTDARHAYYLFK